MNGKRESAENLVDFYDNTTKQLLSYRKMVSAISCKEKKDLTYLPKKN